MQHKAADRRRRRSDDTRTALGYQLDHAREEGALDAVVLADADGLIVAASGDIDVCLELAALAPIVGRRDFLPSDTRLSGAWVHVRAVQFEGSELYLASCSDSLADIWSARLETWLAQAGNGITRILAA